MRIDCVTGRLLTDAAQICNYAQDFKGWVQYHLGLKSAAETRSQHVGER